MSDTGWRARLQRAAKRAPQGEDAGAPPLSKAKASAVAGSAADPPPAKAAGARGSSAKKSGGGGGKQKRFAGGGDSSQIVYKSLLSLFFRLREVEAAVLTVGIGPRYFAPVTAGKQAAQQYTKAVRASGKDHGLGGPGPHVFLAFLSALIECAEIGTGATQAALKAWLEELDDSEMMDNIEELIPVFRIAKMYDAEQVRIVLHVRDNDKLRILVKALGECNIVMKRGRPPRSNLERKLGELVGDDEE